MRQTCCAAILTALGLLAACAPVEGSTTTPNNGSGLPPELVFCRTQTDRLSTSDIQLRTAQNLGTSRVFDRTGRECSVRVHPDGNRLVFVRERTPGTRTTRELVISSIDGTTADTQVTSNTVQDDTPSWSPTGDRFVFATARNGDSQLYTAAADGQNQQLFQSAPAGTDDRDPDWSRTTDRIVFARRDPGTGLRRLMLINGDGTGLVPLTTGSPATVGDTETGDRDPAFSPDGSRVVFVRLAGSGVGQMLSVDTTSGVITAVYDPAGNVRYPRFSTTGDRIFCGIDQPTGGRPGLRLAALRSDGTEPRLIEPGKQWLLDGIDTRNVAAAPTEGAYEALDVRNAEIQLASGSVTQGGAQQLTSVDQQYLRVATTTFETHEVAGINCRFTIPTTNANDILSVRVRIIANVSRSDANTTLRTSLYNPVAKRFDTVAEVPQPGTGNRELTFTTQSLAHVTLERDVRFTVIGEVGQGAVAELNVDYVLCEFVRRVVPQ